MAPHLIDMTHTCRQSSGSKDASFRLCAGCEAYPGKAVKHVRHDQGLPQHEQQRWEHRCEERACHILLATVPVPGVTAPPVAHCHGGLRYNACHTHTHTHMHVSVTLVVTVVTIMIVIITVMMISV